MEHAFQADHTKLRKDTNKIDENGRKVAEKNWSGKVESQCMEKAE